MTFDFKEEKERLALASENVQRVMNKYDEILLNLSDRDKKMLELHYYFKKLDTIKNMSPKGDYYNDRKEGLINRGIELIEKLGNELFSGDNSIEELKNKVNSYMDDSDLPSIINGFSTDIKNAYKEYCDHVYTMLPIPGIKELEESKHRENQFLNRIYDGVFATGTMESVEKYIARGVVGGMIVNGNKIVYPSNPFSNVSDEELTLQKPVSIYLSDVDLFEPQFDYEIDTSGKPHFLFGGEWVAPYERVKCIEKQTTTLPATFLEDNSVFYKEHGEEIQIASPSKTY